MGDFRDEKARLEVTWLTWVNMYPQTACNFCQETLEQETRGIAQSA